MSKASKYANHVAQILSSGETKLSYPLVDKTISGLTQAINKELKARNITDKRVAVTHSITASRKIVVKLVPKIDWKNPQLEPPTS